jgi:hypothetical protein
MGKGRIKVHGTLSQVLSTYDPLTESFGQKVHDHRGRNSYAAVGRLVMSRQLPNRLLIS